MLKMQIAHVICPLVKYIDDIAAVARLALAQRGAALTGRKLKLHKGSLTGCGVVGA